MDGTLVMEFMLMEQYILDSIERNIYDAYTCAVDEYPYMACLDIASPSTLAGTINISSRIDSNEDLLRATVQMYAPSRSDTLFGGDESCDGKVVGDGVISVLDMVVLMWVNFRIPPYNVVTSTSRTVEGQNNVGDRCEDNITREEFLIRYDLERPCVIPTNLPMPIAFSADGLSDDHMYTSIHLHRKTPYGAWFHVHNRDILIATEMVLSGLDSMTEIPLSNLRAPWRPTDVATPFDPQQFELRHARHFEFTEDNTELYRCAPIQGLVSSGALYRNTIGIGQVPTHLPGTPHDAYLCGFDVFIYVPGADDCTVSIQSGSRAIDGIAGRESHADIECNPTPFNFEMYHSTSRPHPPPAPASSTPSAAPPSPPDTPRDTPVSMVFIFMLIGVILCCSIRFLQTTSTIATTTRLSNDMAASDVEILTASRFIHTTSTTATTTRLSSNSVGDVEIVNKSIPTPRASPKPVSAPRAAPTSRPAPPAAPTPLPVPQPPSRADPAPQPPSHRPLSIVHTQESVRLRGPF